MTRRGGRLALALAAAALAAGAAGCGLGEGESRDVGAELLVTRDFGRERIAGERIAELREGETVMRALRARHRVETRFGGGFVQSIDGVAGTSGERRRDWFYFVNGEEASEGAAEREISPGEVVQWDLRDWGAAMRIPAIVGAYPEPFVHGLDGERLPVRLECEAPRDAACEEVRRRLGAHGVPVGRGGLGAGGREVLRVVVGRWSFVRDLVTLQVLEDEPRRSGVFARFRDGGERLELLDDAGAVARVAPAGTGLVAATARAEDPPVWAVTGVDEQGVEAAARALDERALRGAFAVAATPGGLVRLPVGEGAP